MSSAADTLDTLDRLIHQQAEHPRTADREAVVRLLKGRELFAPVEAVNFEAPPGGEPMTIGPGMDLRLGTATVSGKTLLLLCTRPEHPRLAGRQYSGITFEQVLGMIEGAPGLDGFLVYNAGESYFGLTREGFAWMRNILIAS